MLPTEFEIKPKKIDSTSSQVEEEKIACDMVTHFSEDEWQEMDSHWKNKDDLIFNLLDSDAKHDLLQASEQMTQIDSS